MPDTEQNSGTPKDWTATLVRGRSFTLGINPGINFQRGVSKDIDDATKKRLEKKAVDKVMVDDGDEGFEEDVKPKFSFRRIGEPEPEPGAARARPRRVIK